MGVIEKCQQDYYAGRDLSRSIPGLSATEETIIVAESLEADSLWQAPPQVLMKRATGRQRTAMGNDDRKTS